MLFRPGDELEHKAVKHAALFTHHLQACSRTFNLARPFLCCWRGRQSGWAASLSTGPSSTPPSQSTTFPVAHSKCYSYTQPTLLAVELEHMTVEHAASPKRCMQAHESMSWYHPFVTELAAYALRFGGPTGSHSTAPLSTPLFMGTAWVASYGRISVEVCWFLMQAKTLGCAPAALSMPPGSASPTCPLAISPARRSGVPSQGAWKIAAGAQPSAQPAMPAAYNKRQGKTAPPACFCPPIRPVSLSVPPGGMRDGCRVDSGAWVPQEGQKAIYHLEAFVARFMSDYKVWTVNAMG